MNTLNNGGVLFDSATRFELNQSKWDIWLLLATVSGENLLKYGAHFQMCCVCKNVLYFGLFNVGECYASSLQHQHEFKADVSMCNIQF